MMREKLLEVDFVESKANAVGEQFVKGYEN